MKNKLATFGTTSNKRTITDGEFQDGFEYNSILESSYLNGQINRVDEQVYIITQELVHVLEDSGITLDPSDNSQLAGLIANKSLSNLTSTGKNIANWSSNVSNCITEIPQDIKLELNAGTLTLKAGSKLYVPNGAGVFTEVITTQDLSRSVFGTDTGIDRYIFPVYSGGSITGLSWGTQTNVSSGTTPPTNGTFYNTSTNYINNYSGGSAADQRAFPIGKMTLSSGTPISIDQVFNGFGYIGHHAYKLPNVKGLVAYGRNEDETLKSFAVASSSVQVYELPNNREDTYMYISRANTFIMGSKVSDGYPKYDANKNWCYCNSSSTDSYLPVVKFATNSSNQVTLFEIKTPFHAVDYGDLSNYVGKTGDETISGLKTLDSGSATSLRTLSNLIDASVTPQINQYSNFYDNLDKNGARLTRIYTFRSTNGENVLGIQAWDGNLNYSITIGSKGTTSAPTPATNDSSTKIATTSFVKTYLQYVNVLPVNPDSNVFYAIPE